MCPEEKISAKDALLRAAEELFSEKGFSAVGTRELAQRAGVNLGAIQYHYGSKLELFVETIRSLLGGAKLEESLFLVHEFPATREEAAVHLCYLVRAFITEMCNCEGPDPCRMMIREIHGSTCHDEQLKEVLVSTVTEEFFCPIDDRVLNIIRVILPEAEETKLQLIAQSIYGQCHYYYSDRPYLERMRGRDMVVEPHLTEVCTHISSFTLKALDFTEKEIEKTLSKTTEYFKQQVEQ